MSENVPAWAWDLLIACLNYEDVHHADSLCMSSVLNAIPAEVRYTAREIDGYRAHKEQAEIKLIAEREKDLREQIAARFEEAAQHDANLNQNGDRGMLIATWQAAAEIARGEQ